ncbi:MAG TPA: GMC family oxidoreductase [Candidatus Baltobacteraceae bacterium]|nr:GMC family oxidoreductase [Candidatus Baltobacteraceae bacterium]
MNVRRKTTLLGAVKALAPPDARPEAAAALAANAIDRLSPRRRAELNQLLDLLALPMRLPRKARAGMLRSMADSPLGKLRTGFAALKRLALFMAYAENDAPAPNPTWKRIGYPGPRNDRTGGDPLPPLSAAFEGERVEADVVVIGSGAGGGVAAATFARAGKRVVVLEAGSAWSARDVTQSELSVGDLYLEGGLASSQDLGTIVLAGATLGGGTTINWSTSFRLAPRIANEWEIQSGLRGLGSDLTPHFDALERELQLAPCPQHNANNAVLAAGARALGVHVASMPRNAPVDCGAGCGYCGMGCAYGKKRSTLKLYLPLVTANRGAIYVRARAERVLFDGKRARGVTALQTDASGAQRRFEVAAKTVVCAAGSLRTPGILARSGVASNLLGKRLFVHPVFACRAVFERPIEGWHGPIQSAYSDAFSYRIDNYGSKLEVAPVHPAFAAMALPWESAEAHARAMDELPRTALLIALTRDRDPGSVDLDSEAAIHYALGAFDAENVLAGLVAAIDVAFAGGAERVRTLHNAPLTLERREWSASAKRALAERLAELGVAPNRQPLFSAHQMGTAAMGASPRTSVVDAAGCVWGYENLLVADASLFPQASGVNPMLTIMALARRVATLACA